MQVINVENGQRFNQYPEAKKLSLDDIALIRSSDNTGVKALKLAALKLFIEGDLATLSTKDKASVIAAINELVSGATTMAQSIETLEGLTEILGLNSAGLKNSIWRGKYLGDRLTAEQSAAIRDGSFKDLWLGDYWTMGGVNYRIMDFDYWYQTGDTACTTHHVVVVPDTTLYTAQMNTSNTTNGGYSGSAMRTSNLNQAKTTIKNAFGASHILTHRALFSNAVSNGSASGWAWVDSDIDLMSEHMVYGARAWGGGAHNGYDVGEAKSQLAGFRLRHDLEHTRSGWYWLRDVNSAAVFADCSNYGDASGIGASDSGGVRPAFPIY